MRNCVQSPRSNFKTVEQIKAEAYKEFVDRLKNSNEFYNSIRAIGNVDQADCVVNCIDNLLKEMLKGKLNSQKINDFYYKQIKEECLKL